MSQMQGLLFERPVDQRTVPAARAESNVLSSLILVTAAALMAIGVIMVFSSTARLDNNYWPENPIRSTAVRQTAFTLLGLLAMGIAYQFGYHRWRWRGAELKLSKDGRVLNTDERAWLREPVCWLMVLMVGCLLAVLIPGVGVERNGARRWLMLGPASLGIGFQPSELAKLVTLLFMAAWLSYRHQIMSQFWKGIIPAVLIIGLLAGLIVPEDLGTAALVVLVGGILILANGARWWHAGLLALPGLAGFVGMILVKPYRLERIASYQDIWADPLGSGYHVIQSLIAIAAGGWWGEGLGAGTQKFGYLPEAQTDFVYALLIEEMGLIGGWVVLGLFVLLALLGWWTMLRAQTRFGKLLALGITMMIGVQAAMNIAVVTVSVPTKGISLPFISAGGSGVLFYSITVGFLASIARHPRLDNTGE
ncbi:MAG: putative lipid II flippase FtsW [Phycisphaerae bacterium]|nr:putative lipid II flippase FtsW [Phycisphaerae bacterium]